MIKSIEQYNELATLTDQAQDRLITGSGEAGVHYLLIHILGKHGINAYSREEAIKEAQKLCDKFIQGMTA